MNYSGIPYFPVNANFFEEDVLELLEAQFGIRASYIVMRLLCKIYKEGYHIPWGKEQSLIFIRKIGGEINEETMDRIVELLLEKGFFHKKSYEEYSILTSEQIQKVWLEATVRRKRDFSKLPYLLTMADNPQGNGKQKEDTSKENADHLPTQGELNLENEDNSEQTKLNKTKALTEEEGTSHPSFEIPEYAYNKDTHNIAGLIESLEHYKVTDPKEQQTILKLTDYGRKGTQVWKLFPNTNWAKIGAPGKYIIAVLANERKRAD